MDKRTFKQVIYGGAYLAIIIFCLTSIFFLFVKPAPTCFDKKQNQDEVGVDCGGVCAQICLPDDLEPITTVEDVDVFFPTPDKVTILGRIKNPNNSHGAFVAYTIIAYNKEGKSLSQFPANTILYPGQVRYIIVPGFDISTIPESIDRAELKVTKTEWQTADLLPKPQVTVRDQSVQRIDAGFVSVKGNIINSDIVSIPKVQAVAVFFNRFRMPIGAARTELANLRSGETREFTILHPILSSFVMERTEVFLSTD